MYNIDLLGFNLSNTCYPVPFGKISTMKSSKRDEVSKQKQPTELFCKLNCSAPARKLKLDKLPGC